jgi:8-oxo-dGTP pyrophosphatase MutT (NUDIX family)
MIALALALSLKLSGCSWWSTSGPEYDCVPPGTQIAAPRAAGCLAVSGGKLLLVQGTSGRWTIPGGYVESGEDSATAAARETWEEARVRVAAGAPVCAVPASGFVAHACTPSVALVSPPPAADGRETRDARFMTRAEIEALTDGELRFPAQKGAYLRYLDGGAQ